MYRGWTKIMETAVKNIHFFINMEFSHCLPVTAFILLGTDSCKFWIVSLVEYCTTFLLVAWQMMEGICFSPCSLKLTTVVPWYLSLSIVLAREDAEVHLHATQNKTEHFWQCVCTNRHLEKLHHCWEATSRPQNAPGYIKCPRSHWQ